MLSRRSPELAAQPCDVRVDGPRGDSGPPPDQLEQLGPAVHPQGVGDEVSEQLVLQVRQLEGLAVHIDEPVLGLDGQLCDGGIDGETAHVN